MFFLLLRFRSQLLDLGVLPFDLQLSSLEEARYVPHQDGPFLCQCIPLHTSNTASYTRSIVMQITHECTSENDYTAAVQCQCRWIAIEMTKC